MEGVYLVVNVGKCSFKCKLLLSVGNFSYVVIVKWEYILGKFNVFVVFFDWLGDNMWIYLCKIVLEFL